VSEIILPPQATRSQVTEAIRAWLKGVPDEIRSNLVCLSCRSVPQELRVELLDNHDAKIALDCHGRRFAVLIPASRWDRGPGRPRKLIAALLEAADELARTMNRWGTRPLPDAPHTIQ
jgi:hypothetical protein